MTTPHSAPQGSSTRIPALDGVRGIAILAVFTYHATSWGGPRVAAWGSWGWMGVDLFFVLSGYLITGILLDTRERADYYTRFYLKRALRILPAFIAFMLVLAFIAPMHGPERATFVHNQAWYWGYGANVVLALHGWPSLPFETGHLWSLALEEQFYLIWPFVIARCSRPRTAVLIALSVIASVTALRTIAVLKGVNALPIYVLPMFRADALAWGAFLAALERRGNAYLPIGRLRSVAFLLGGLVLVLVVARLRNANNPSPSMQIVGYPAVAAVCFGIVATRAKWLGATPLALMGRYSYGFYLWHAPTLLVLGRLLNVPWAVFVLAGFIVTMGITLVSWTLIERPALSLKELHLGLNRRTELLPSEARE